MHEYPVLDAPTAEHDRGCDGRMPGDEGFHRCWICLYQMISIGSTEKPQERTYLLSSGEDDLVVGTAINSEQVWVARVLLHKIVCRVRLNAIYLSIDNARRTCRRVLVARSVN